METLIADVEGKWYLTKARFAFTDPTNGTLFAPGVYVKATATEWLALQAGLIDEVPDPLKAAEQAAAAGKAAAEAASKAAEAAAKASKAAA